LDEVRGGIEQRWTEAGEMELWRVTWATGRHTPEG
jgi:hypothetical protein